MDTDSFLVYTGKLYEELMAEANDEDYAIDETQLNKLLDIIEFLFDMCNKNNGAFEPCTLIPKRQHGGVTARFYMMSLAGEEIDRFCDVMRGASAISIDAELDGRICFSVTVPYVYKKK